MFHVTIIVFVDIGYSDVYKLIIDIAIVSIMGVQHVYNVTVV